MMEQGYATNMDFLRCDKKMRTCKQIFHFLPAEDGEVTSDNRTPCEDSLAQDY